MKSFLPHPWNAPGSLGVNILTSNVGPVRRAAVVSQKPGIRELGAAWGELGGLGHSQWFGKRILAPQEESGSHAERVSLPLLHAESKAASTQGGAAGPVMWLELGRLGQEADSQVSPQGKGWRWNT